MTPIPIGSSARTDRYYLPIEMNDKSMGSNKNQEFDLDHEHLGAWKCKNWNVPNTLIQILILMNWINMIIIIYVFVFNW